MILLFFIVIIIFCTLLCKGKVWHFRLWIQGPAALLLLFYDFTHCRGFDITKKATFSLP